MTRRKLTMLIVLLALTISSGNFPRTAEPVVPPPEPVVAEEVLTHHDLLSEWRMQLVNDIRIEHLINKTGIDEELATRIVEAVDKEAIYYGLDPNRILAFIIVESWANPEAESSKGALGLMQVMPDTGKFIARAAGFKWDGVGELKLVESNISYGTWYYHHLLKKFRGDEHAAIAAYNWGPEHIRGRMKRAEKLPQVYPGKVYAAQEELQGVIWNEYNARLWRGFDQYVRNANQRRDTPRPAGGGEYCQLPGSDAQGLCVRVGTSVPASPGDLSR